MMTQRCTATVDRVGEGDLSLFRDAVLAYCQSLRQKRPFHCQATPEAADLLAWLGVEIKDNKVSPAEGELSFPQTPAFPTTPLSEYRDRGFLGTTLFAGLVRSSYGPDEPGYFPTQSELGFYFEEEQIRSEIRWDEEYLAECQEFFFEELTPAEMLSQAMDLLSPDLESLKVRYETELLGVTFLIGEQETYLTPLSQFLQRLLTPTTNLEALEALVGGQPDWSPDSVRAGWQALEVKYRSELEQDFFGPYRDQAEDILVACGEQFLKWRAGLD